MARDKIAIFDFDGTLIQGDSFISFARHAYGRWRFGLKLLQSAPWLVAWKLGLIPSGKAKEHLFGCLYKGLDVTKWREMCRGFLPVIEADIRESVMDRLKFHRSQGHRLIILTASPPDWILPWAEKEGVERVIGTGMEVSDGKLTGRFTTPNCIGPEKVKRLQEALPEVAGSETWAYGDSASDAYVLSFATHGTKV